MADAFSQEPLKDLSEARRAFVRKLILGAAFVVPSVMTFPLSDLGLAQAIAQTGNFTIVLQSDERALASDERALTSDEHTLASDERKLEPSHPPPDLHTLASEPHGLAPPPYQSLSPAINAAQVYRGPK